MKNVGDIVLDLARTGMRPAEVAAALGRPSGTVASALSRARARGVVVPRSHPGPVPGTRHGCVGADDTRRQAIISMAVEGLPPRDIAARLGMTASSVSVTLSRMRAAGVQVPVGRAGRPRSV